MLSLKEIPGIGDSLAEKLISEIGTLEDVERVIKDGDVGALSGIEGISPQRAVKLINSANKFSNELIITDEGRRLHKDLISNISDFIITKSAKERLSIMTPLSRTSITEIESRRTWSKNSIKFINESRSSFQIWKDSIAGLNYAKEPISKVDRVIVVPNVDELEKLRYLSKKCRILVRSKDENWQDYVGLNKVTWIGNGAPDKLPPGWIIGKSSDCLCWFKGL